MPIGPLDDTEIFQIGAARHFAIAIEIEEAAVNRTSNLRGPAGR